MTEKRFERIYADVNVFCRDHNAKGLSQLIEKEDYDTIVDLLNRLADENAQLRVQLNLCSDQRNEFHRGARENANRVGKLEKENEQLKQINERFSNTVAEQIIIIKEYREKNEQLKQQLNYIQNSISEHVKHQKTELGQKALQEIIEDYNEWLLGHKELKE